MSPVSRALNVVRALDILGERQDAVTDAREARLLTTAAAMAATTEERLIVETLRGPGCLRVAALVKRVSAALYREELRHGGAAADLGFFGEHLFVPEVRRVLEGGHDRLWTISSAR